MIYDRFQQEAIDYINQGHSVIVSAPTGAGKTAIAEYIISGAIRNNLGVIYTAPIKALSNQKFRDFKDQFQDNIGILTGDVSTNPLRLLVVGLPAIPRSGKGRLSCSSGRPWPPRLDAALPLRDSYHVLRGDPLRFCHSELVESRVRRSRVQHWLHETPSRRESKRRCRLRQRLEASLQKSKLWYSQNQTVVVVLRFRSRLTDETRTYGTSRTR